MKQKLQAVLNRVKEPETNLAVTELGLVERIRYDHENGKLLVFLNTIRPGSVCCSRLGGFLLDSTKQNLSEVLGRAFPELSVQYM
ncbi:hypothetical protein ACFL0M_09530 [Thermodesulfobacteriota bacterium]